MRELTINDEFRDLLPKLSTDEFSALEQSIVDAGGIHSPIIIWDNTIIDGHNRYEICKSHDLEFRTEERRFADEDEVKLWIFRNQIGRRNLPKYLRCSLALKVKPALQKEALGRMQAGTNPMPNLAQGGAVRDLIAKLAGVSHGTLSKVQEIEEVGSDDLKQEVQSGEISIDAAYKRLKVPADREQSDTVQIQCPTQVKIVTKLRDVAEKLNDIRQDLSDDDKDGIRAAVETLNDIAPPLEHSAGLAVTALESSIAD